MATAQDALAAVPTVAPPRLAPSGSGPAFAAFGLAFLAVLLLANAAADQPALPDYGTWTGVVPLEQKLRLLEHFARAGPVDALVLSSSLGDHGLSVAALSEEMGRSRGQPWRAFNFSSGGADIPSCLLLYRLARTVARPRLVMVATPADRSIGDAPNPRGPESVLAQAPVGAVVRHPPALLLARWFWSLPLVRGAAPLRDYAIHGRFAGVPASHSDFYPLSEEGDTLNYNLDVSGREAAHRARSGREETLAECFLAYSKARTPDERRRVFLSDRTVDALAELARLARRDGARLMLVANDSTAGFRSRDPHYRQARKLYDEELSRVTGLPVVDFLDDFWPPPHEFADNMHLNLHGARRFARMLAARLEGRSGPPAPPPPAPDVARIDGRDPTFSAWPAVLVGEGVAAPRTLEIRLISSASRPGLAVGSALRMVLRQPDDTDLVLRTKVVEPTRILCDVSRLEAGERIYVARLVSTTTGRASLLPLAGYGWSKEPFPADSTDGGEARLGGARQPVRPGEQFRASWSAVKEPAADDWIGLFAADGPEDSLMDPVPTRGRPAGSASITVPSGIAPGRYELRLFAHGAWRRLATSPAFEVLPSPTVVEPRGGPFRAGGALEVAWRDAVAPAKDDWIGLFAVHQPDGTSEEARVPFAFTGGAEAGEIRIDVPADLAPGRYELRLFSRSREGRLATSRAFRLRRPEPR